jgi:hypothetical protein
LRLDVLETDTLPEVHPYVSGTPLSSPSVVTLPYPIRLSAIQKLDFYTERQGFNLLGMFRNPMMMMMALGGVMVFAMPYIMVSHFLVCMTQYMLMTLSRKISILRFCKISRNGKRELALSKVHSIVVTSSRGESYLQTAWFEDVDHLW